MSLEKLEARTKAEELAELKRELGMRRAVYPRQVSAGRMTQAAADRQTELLERAIARLEAA